MTIIFSEHACEDYLYWQKRDRRFLDQINRLIQSIKRSTCEGIGKPEPLKHGLRGLWSRRINQEHRIVYKVEEGVLYVAQLRYHYR